MLETVLSHLKSKQNVPTLTKSSLVRCCCNDFVIKTYQIWFLCCHLRYSFTVFSVKPWRPEKFSGLFIVSRPIRCEMKPHKITAKPQHWLVTTWRETTSWLSLLREIFNFKYWNFSLSISALLSPKNSYELHFTEKRWKLKRQDQSIRHS